MPDFDLHKPSPDAGHEGIRQAVVYAIADLDYTNGDVAVSLDLVDMLFQFLGESLTERGELQAQVDLLIERVAALEGYHAVLPGPDAAG